ncbi:hypothetical protein PAPHI01_0578, partial [Pancytospora philotis]
YMSDERNTNITAYFAICLIYTTNAIFNSRIQGIDLAYDRMFKFFFNETQTGNAHPRIREVMGEPGLMERLPWTFYYRIFDDFCRKGEDIDIRNIGITVQLLFAFPDEKYHTVKKIAGRNNNINLLKLLDFRFVAPSPNI